MTVNRVRVLFVDDERGVLNGLARQFHRQREHWDMVFIDRPAEALAAMRRHPAEIVVTDLRMPEMDGITLITRMREIAPDASYMILTGTADLPTVIEAINEARVYRFFTKPCPRDRLMEGITDAIRLIRPQQGAAMDSTSTANPISALTLDRIPIGIMVVDGAGRLRLSNHAGDRILAAKDGLYVDGAGICRTSSAETTRALHARLRAIASAMATGVLDSQTVAIERPSLLRPLAVTMAPLAPSGNGEWLVTLMIRDPDRQSVPSVEAVASIFGLSRAEAVIACALAQGLRIEDAAVDAGVTISTARTYLKHIFAKTHTNRQSDLVKLLLAYAIETASTAAA